MYCHNENLKLVIAALETGSRQNLERQQGDFSRAGRAVKKFLETGERLTIHSIHYITCYAMAKCLAALPLVIAWKIENALNELVDLPLEISRHNLKSAY